MFKFLCFIHLHEFNLTLFFFISAIMITEMKRNAIISSTKSYDVLKNTDAPDANEEETNNKEEDNGSDQEIDSDRSIEY